MSSQTSNSSIDVEYGSKKWIDAHYDPMAKLYTFSQCMVTGDIFADSDYKLIVADLGTGSAKIKLKVYKGTALMNESALLDLPTAICVFYMDQNEPRTPAIAVGSGSNLFVYKNMRPYYKFNLPSMVVNQTETDLWEQAKIGSIDPASLREMLSSLTDQQVPLTNRSQKFLTLRADEALQFIYNHAGQPLKRQTVITCMATMKKSAAEEDSISCIVLGTEMATLFIVDAEAFTVLIQVRLDSVPSFIHCTGLYDVDYRIIVACRNGTIYSARKAEAPKFVIDLKSQPVALTRTKNIVVACMDEMLHCYTTKGKKVWTLQMPGRITAMTSMDHQRKGFVAVIVAISNGEVRIYREKHLVDTIRCQEPVNGLLFGRFGREENCLLMVTAGGSLMVKILKRTASFDDTGALESVGPPIEQFRKLDVPKKTKLFVDQTIRERENAVGCAIFKTSLKISYTSPRHPFLAAMHRTFQQDLLRLRLRTARNYAESLCTGMTPVSTDPTEPLKLNASVTGLGPIFKLSLSLQNTSLTKPSTDLFMTFDYDRSIYSARTCYIPVAFLVPGLTYTYSTLIDCVSDQPISDKVKVYLVREGSTTPLLTAVIAMPIAENIEM